MSGDGQIELVDKVQFRSSSDFELGRSASGFPNVPGYDIVAELGRGNMGVVYKARQIELDRLVALKMIRAGADADAEELQRFVTEARVLASLQHPNIVQLYDINLNRETPYFSMELIEGGSLVDQIGGMPQPFRKTAQLILILARAIHVAHENGIVHRDLKPANILIAPPRTRNSHVQRLEMELDLHPSDIDWGTPKISDFGLAKKLHGSANQTESGMIMGTPSYMAPEQAEGKSNEVGPAADIYALGAILYELLTGRPPFTAESPVETVLLMFQTEPVAPSRLQPKIPRNLETICLKCLRKEPHRRYATALDVAEDLRRFLADEPILAHPAGWPEKTWKWMRRRPAIATLAGCSAVAAAGLLGFALWHQVELHTRLGEAIADERDARHEQEVVSERERVGHLQDRIKDLLRTGEKAVAAQDWPNARLHLTRARDQSANEPELADTHSRIGQLLDQTERQRQDTERLKTFFRHRDDALFSATLFTGDDLEVALGETQSSIVQALSLFGVAPGSIAALDVESPYYSKEQKTEITTACYELLIVLSDVVATATTVETKSDRAVEALSILDRAATLGVSTQAYHRRRASYLKQSGQVEAADREQLLADALKASTPFDHFLIGQEQFRLGHYKQAISAFENVRQVQPEHFWASYYLALCWLKTQRPDQAVACLTAGLVQRNNFPWLFLLRATAWGELNQFDRAEADFATAFQMPLTDTVRYGLLINRGVMRIRQGHLDDAFADLRQAVALRPRQYQGYVNLAQAFLKAKQLKEAVAQLDQAIELESGVASLYRTRARLHLVNEDRVAALADIDRAIEVAAGVSSADLAEDHLERGRILHLQRDFNAALDGYAVAIQMAPRNTRAYRLRADSTLR